MIIRAYILISVFQFICQSQQSIISAQNVNTNLIDSTYKLKLIRVYKQIKYDDKTYKSFNKHLRLEREIYYLENGLKEKELVFNKDKEPYEKTVFEYDSVNNITCWLRTRTKYTKGGKYYKIDYSYNDKYQLVNEIHHRDIHYNDIVLYLNINYTYNSIDSIIRINHNEDKVIKTLYYDSENRKNLEKTAHENENKTEYRKFYYNNYGYLILEKDSSINKSQYGVEYTYNVDKLVKIDWIAYKHSDIYQGCPLMFQL
jgi:hypothetical protein